MIVLCIWLFITVAILVRMFLDTIYIYTNIHICIITRGLTTPRRTSVKALAMVVPPLKEAWARHKMLAKRDPHYTRYEQDSTMSGANRHI